MGRPCASTPHLHPQLDPSLTLVRGTNALSRGTFASRRPTPPCHAFRVKQASHVAPVRVQRKVFAHYQRRNLAGAECRQHDLLVLEALPAGREQGQSVAPWRPGRQREEPAGCACKPCGLLLAFVARTHETAVSPKCHPPGITGMSPGGAAFVKAAPHLVRPAPPCCTPPRPTPPNGTLQQLAPTGTRSCACSAADLPAQPTTPHPTPICRPPQPCAPLAHHSKPIAGIPSARSLGT